MPIAPAPPDDLTAVSPTLYDAEQGGDMDASRARDILRNNRYCIIATASPEGVPWLSPLFFNYDVSCRILWESARDARHSLTIAANPQVAIVVSDLEGPGSSAAVYFEAEAREVPLESMSEALDIYLEGPHKKSDSITRHVIDYMDDSPIRLYEAVPMRAYTLAQTTTPEGYTLDQRVEIDLAALGVSEP